MLKFTAKQLKNQPFRNLDSQVFEWFRKGTNRNMREVFGDAGRRNAWKEKASQRQFLRKQVLSHVRLAQGQERRSQNQRYHEMARNWIRQSLYFRDVDSPKRKSGRTSQQRLINTISPLKTNQAQGNCADIWRIHTQTRNHLQRRSADLPPLTSMCFSSWIKAILLAGITWNRQSGWSCGARSPAMKE